ncbi:uncharacterized protein LOC112190065 isoform X2 [Rosa chinensis]|uniref:uncharacterized protein LOC112190065 isoform X2 n=1 Tax=Rosa chinensis TaxID=74649 RepID=UPI000D08C90E|nr:uncharacterized protein LOC112190065 isoform X2 [Rosa chinensis]
MNTPFHDHEKKQKKSFMSSYKPSPGRHLKPDSKPNMVDKYPVLRSWFSLSRKSKTRQDVLDQFEHAQIQREEPNKQVGVVAESARKSVSHVESNLVSVASFLQVKVLVSDMPGFMQVHAFRSARRTYDSLEKFSPKHMAYNLKKDESLRGQDKYVWIYAIVFLLLGVSFWIFSSFLLLMIDDVG